jgi:hypothetical protein
VRLLAVLDHLPHHAHPGCAQQLTQLLQTLTLRQGRNAEGALACTLGRLIH